MRKQFLLALSIIMMFSMLVGGNALSSDASAEQATQKVVGQVEALTEAPEEQAAAGNTAPALASSEEGLISSGFDPAVDAFKFPNYTNKQGFANLSEAEMQRMFGNKVCANLTNGCTLTPPAGQWMEKANRAMGKGHCEGMAVLSSLIFYNQIDPATFGGSTASQLIIKDNEALQHEIAYWWTTQATRPAKNIKIDASPNIILERLIETFQQDQAAEDKEMWVMGIAHGYHDDNKNRPIGGHTITPYAVEDIGGGISKVYVYDNNYPNQARTMEINRNDNTWEYEASQNTDSKASLYKGDASTNTLLLLPITPRLKLQEPHFQKKVDIKTNGLAAPLLEGHDVTQVWLDGDANLLITTEDGRRIGWLEDGTFVDEIDGAEPLHFRYGVEVWEIDEEPVYLLPGDIERFDITVDGSQLEEGSSAEVAVIGPGFYMEIEDLWIGPGERDLIKIDEKAGDHFTMGYQSDYTESPDILFGIETDGADYEFIVRGTDIESGGSFNVTLDFPNENFIVDTLDEQEFGFYDLLILRIDDEGEHVFGSQDIRMEPHETMYVNFLHWEGEGDKMRLDFDINSDGKIDHEMVLEDESHFYEDFYGDWEHYFPETDFRIDHDLIWDYFQSQGGVDTFGYPVSKVETYRGFEVQIFQRHVLQINGSQVRPLNLLDPDVMPINSFGGLTFPKHDQTLAASAPAPNAANYGSAVSQHLEANVPNTWQGQPVGFLSYYLSTAPAKAGDLRPLLALEVWGFPTSQPMRDPNNENFIYQRFQRGIMHYDATTNVTRGILLGDAFKERSTLDSQQ